jgi:hypothetical protein
MEENMKRVFSLLLPLALLALPAIAPAADGPVAIMTAPDPVLVVAGEHSQQIVLDFLVCNKGETALEFATVVMTAFDGRGALVTRREINRLGMCPSIGMLPFAVVEPGKTVIAFNPFQELPRSMELKTLKFAFAFTVKGNEKKIESLVTVHPVVHAAKTPLSLPVRGKVIVWDGWDLYAHHRRLDLTHPLLVDLGVKNNITRFGMDFMQVDGEGRTFAGAGERLEDYYIFKKPVLAPAAGTVTDCIAERPDSPIGQMLVDYEALQRTKDLRLLGGNYVVIDHGNGEFSFFCHLRQGSLKVRQGDRVKAGQPIGEVGSSGDSAEPHLHYQLRSSANPDCASIPAEFRGFRRWYGSRSEFVKSGYVNSGDLVEAL